MTDNFCLFKVATMCFNRLDIAVFLSKVGLQSALLLEKSLDILVPEREHNLFSLILPKVAIAFFPRDVSAS